MEQLQRSCEIPMAGIVAAGLPIEPIAQSESVEVPQSMLRGGDTFALRVKGESMKEDGILPGDLIIVRKQSMARNGQTVVAIINSEATVKVFHRKDGHVELHPANAAMEPILLPGLMNSISKAWSSVLFVIVHLMVRKQGGLMGTTKRQIMMEQLFDMEKTIVQLKLRVGSFKRICNRSLRYTQIVRQQNDPHCAVCSEDGNQQDCPVQ